jgi:hypothetical protein
MKKGKKMPSIELEGHSEAKFVLVDGKIVRADAMQQAAVSGPSGPSFEIDRRFRD